ncbi:SRPBCC family protein [Streptomonospora mangrovi]
MPGHVLLETATLEKVEGGTKYTSVSVFQSVEDRDGMDAAGMEHGARADMEKLAELVEKKG